MFCWHPWQFVTNGFSGTSVKLSGTICQQQIKWVWNFLPRPYMIIVDMRSVSRRTQYKEVYRRTIEILQWAPTFKVNCCFKVHNLHLLKVNISNFGISSVKIIINIHLLMLQLYCSRAIPKWTYLPYLKNSSNLSCGSNSVHCPIKFRHVAYFLKKNLNTVRITHNKLRTLLAIIAKYDFPNLEWTSLY